MELYVIFVLELADSRLNSIFFFAEFGDMPQSDPCLSKILLGGCSDIILQPLSTRAAFTAAYALSISKLTIRSSNHGTS